jgi:hypothetical protein
MFLAPVLDKRAKICLFPEKRRLIVEVRVTTTVGFLSSSKEMFMYFGAT